MQRDTVSRSYRRAAWLVSAALACLSLASCGSAAATARPSDSRAPAQVGAGPSAPRRVDPATVGANELGSVPVLMYHQLLARPRGTYDQTPAQFRAELTTLYAHGYRTATAADLVAGRLDVPAGRRPMVLTFDDATVSQYGELPDGSPDPRSAIGILVAVGRAHGEPHPVATLYVNERPFAGHEAYLSRLSALGMELGEHTRTHADLRRLDDAHVQAELVGGLHAITDADPGARVSTMALPFGAHPRTPRLAYAGSSGGAGYRFAGVMLVGSHPSPSPYSQRFDPLGVPRIRSGLRSGDQAFTSTDWLPQLFSGRVAPYVSDGDPSTVAFPRALAGRLSPRFAARARAY